MCGKLFCVRSLFLDKMFGHRHWSEQMIKSCMLDYQLLHELLEHSVVSLWLVMTMLTLSLYYLIRQVCLILLHIFHIFLKFTNSWHEIVLKNTHPTLPSNHLFFYLSTYIWDLFLRTLVTKVKPNINSVEVYPQLSNFRHHCCLCSDMGSIRVYWIGD